MSATKPDLIAHALARAMKRAQRPLSVRLREWMARDGKDKHDVARRLGYCSRTVRRALNGVTLSHTTRRDLEALIAGTPDPWVKAEARRLMEEL